MVQPDVPNSDMTSSDSALQQALAASECDLVLADDAIQPTQIGFFHQGKLLEFWHQPDRSAMGCIYWARIEQVFARHGRATFRLADDRADDRADNMAASARMPTGTKLQVGQMVLITITAEAQADKPLQAVLGAELVGALTLLKLAGSGQARYAHKHMARDEQGTKADARLIDAARASVPEAYDLVLRRRAAFANIEDIQAEIAHLVSAANEIAPSIERAPAEPRLVFDGLPALLRAKLQAPAARHVCDAAHSYWGDLAMQAEASCDDRIDTKSGACLWFTQSQALMAVDVDSAASKLGLSALLPEICTAFMGQLRLRQLAGIVMLDLPRGSRAEKERAMHWLKALALRDPRHPDILGFGPAGLIEMRVRHGRAPMEDMRAASQIGL